MSFAANAATLPGLSELINQSELELAVWLYGLLALGLILFGISFLKMVPRASAKRWRIAAGVFVVLAMWSDHWVHPKYIPQFCAMAGGHTVAGQLTEGDNLKVLGTKNPWTEYAETHIWKGDGLLALSQSTALHEGSAATFFQFAYYGTRFSRYLSAPFEGFANRVAGRQCYGAAPIVSAYPGLAALPLSQSKKAK